jgi:hypothetical protein
VSGQPRRRVEPLSGWVWWRLESDGGSEAQEEFERLGTHVRAELLLRLRRLVSAESRASGVRRLASDVVELGCQRAGERFGALLLEWGTIWVVLAVFQGDPGSRRQDAVALAKIRRAEWIKSFGPTA